jgi:diguanylate cyclase (GGDEF)-like protein/PAS domain S-box-containing protein
MVFGIKMRIVLISVSVMLFAMGSIIGLSAFLFSREYGKALQSRSVAIATGLRVQLERVLQFGIPLDDLIGFEEQCQEVVQIYGGIDYAMVVGPSGRILFHSDPSFRGEYLLQPELSEAARKGVQRVVPYTGEGARYYGVFVPFSGPRGERLGSIVVGFPDILVTARVSSMVAFDLGLGVLFLTAGIFALVAGLSALVTNPLLRLIASIQDIRRNATDLSRRVTLPISGDIGRLATAFNGLMADLESTTVSKAALESAMRVLQETEERYRRVVETSPSAIFVDCGNRLVFVNPAGVNLLGVSRPEDLYGSPLLDFVELESRARMKLRLHALLNGILTIQENDVRLVRRDGSLREVEITGIAFVYDNRPAVQIVVNDITETRQQSAQLDHLASYDPLTGLPNRNLLTDRLRQAIYHAERTRSLVAVLFLDLDRFKLLNDTQGHSAGDQLLLALARRLKSTLRKSDTVARFGGDEFVFVLNDVEKAGDVKVMATSIQAVISEPFTVGGQEIHVSSSIGISLYPQDGETGELLLRNADAAMHRAKELGCNNLQCYTEELNALLVERTRMHHELRRALEEEQLRLHYQPQVDLATGRIVAMEALVRWQHPRLGLIPSKDFIPLAEETGMIAVLGEWVLREACRQTKCWHRAGLPPIQVAVNLAMQQLADKGLVRLVADILEQTGLAAEFLELELTETGVMQDAEEMVHRLRRLQDLGISLALDDFGTGYSSLSYLKRFAFNRLKIDQSFVRDITTNPEDAAIIGTIIAIGESLGMTVLAEGVETSEALAHLRRMGCHHVQGYLISRPLPPAGAEELLRACGDGPVYLGSPPL